MTLDPNKDGDPSSQRRIHVAAARFAAFYKSCALVFFNTLMLYVLLNLVLGVVFWIKDLSRSPLDDVPVTVSYSADVLDKVYPGYERHEWQAIVAESWTRPYAYEDFTHFREPPFTGTYVSVTDEGYRKSANQGLWPPARENLNIFVFGGSTTFGYGLPDDRTVPSLLQQALAAHVKRRVCVYNFGVAWFYSTQERLRFERLLFQGHVPDIALFIDGVNDTYRSDNKPAFNQEMAQAFEQMSGFAHRASTGRASSASSFWGCVQDVTFRRLPAGRAAAYVMRKIKPQEAARERPAERTDEGSLLRGCKTYFTNKFLIEQSCRHFGVTPVFVWQPGPGYKYDLKYHWFAGPDGFPGMGNFYTTMHEQLQQRPAEPNFLWCADIQQERAECLYCDAFHYNAAFAKVFADFICQLCLERKLFDVHLER